ncbi:hypothetical protein [Actinomadura chokoriensis]|uniref:hypothetical protein n=1 Tax=Actinomadura chokoriensis TaxID=454156 RepID=UPI0031F94274
MGEPREAAVKPHVQAVTPALVCGLQADGWRLLGFERVGGRRVDHTPGSQDLPAALDALVAVDGLKVPLDVDVRWFEGPWSDYVAVPERLPRIAGTALLHSDLSARNVLMTARAHGWSTEAWRPAGRRW